MRIIVVSGSRNPSGQTASASEAFLKGVKDAGGDYGHFLLPTMNIERCRQCRDDGWGICKSEGRCVIDDDFAALVEEIKRADAVVFATPVYFSDLAESLKAFLDRLRRTCMNEEGRKGIKGKRALGICVAGGGGLGSFPCCQIMDKTLLNCGFDVFDITPARRQNLAMKLPLLEGVGRWIVENQPAE